MSSVAEVRMQKHESFGKSLYMLSCQGSSKGPGPELYEARAADISYSCMCVLVFGGALEPSTDQSASKIRLRSSNPGAFMSVADQQELVLRCKGQPTRQSGHKGDIRRPMSRL